MKKVIYEKNGCSAECLKCHEMVIDAGEDGFYCTKCDILFMICTSCNDGTLYQLKAWGSIYIINPDTGEVDSDAGSEPEYDNYHYTHDDDQNPKYFACRDDAEALTDHSQYLWVCPSCKKTDVSAAD